MQPTTALQLIPYNLAKVLTTIPWHFKITRGKGPGADLIWLLSWHRDMLRTGSVFFTGKPNELHYEFNDTWSLPNSPDITVDVAKELLAGLKNGKYGELKLTLNRIVAIHFGSQDYMDLVAEISIAGDSSPLMIVDPITTVYISYNPVERTGTILHKETREDLWGDLGKMLM